MRSETCLEKESRTGSELGLVCDVILVEILRLLLGLLVVDGVGTGCCAKCQPGSAFEVLRLTPQSVMEKHSPPCPEGMLAVCVKFGLGVGERDV
jgi:hypothetical protein